MASSQPTTTMSSDSTSVPQSELAKSNIQKITPPDRLTPEAKCRVFEHLLRRLAIFRNAASLYADLEEHCGDFDKHAKGNGVERGVTETNGNRTVELGAHIEQEGWKDQYNAALNSWAQTLLEKIWVVCCEKKEEQCPVLDPYCDTSSRDAPELPAREDLAQLLNTILFLHLTTSDSPKQYSALTRAFFAANGYASLIDEDAIAWTIKNPEAAVKEAEAEAKAKAKAAEDKGSTRNIAERAVESVRASHAEKGGFMRFMGIGLGAIAGGVLVGVTGGLAAPLVGAALAGVLGWFGVGGTVLALLVSGFAGSSVVCGALFGVYGAMSTAEMVERHTREVKDLKIVPVKTRRDTDGNEDLDDTLAVRLCVSGWLHDKEDVTAPWTIFGGDDTFALQWEIEALETLSNALSNLITSEAMKYVRSEVVKRTIFAGLMHSLAPIALLKVGQVVDNPWMNAKALAIKTGAVLGELLSKRVFGSRPVTLVGYSLGSLVIQEALLHLAELPPAETAHLVQDVYLFGTPASADPEQWTQIRRVAAGRVVNGYAKDDYVLAVLSRASTGTWRIAGLEPVLVKGVENVLCDDVKGHLFWRAMIGKSLQKCQAPGVIAQQVLAQEEAAAPILAGVEPEKEKADNA